MDPSNTVLSYGQKAVGLTFNPSNDPEVQKVKEKYAEVIDLLHNKIIDFTDMEAVRCIKKAIMEAQTASMWAVKAITWK